MSCEQEIEGKSPGSAAAKTGEDYQIKGKRLGIECRRKRNRGKEYEPGHEGEQQGVDPREKAKKQPEQVCGGKAGSDGGNGRWGGNSALRELGDEVPIGRVPEMPEGEPELIRQLVVGEGRHGEHANDQESEVRRADSVGIGILEGLERHVRWTDGLTESSMTAPGKANESGNPPQLRSLKAGCPAGGFAA